jgi:hypothetical protein
MAIAAYLFVNPANKFGYGQKNFVIFNRLPVSFFDLCVAENNAPQPIEDINKKNSLEDFFVGLNQKAIDEPLLLIVGTGFLSEAFRLNDEKTMSLEAKNVSVRQMPSRQAMDLYNTSKKENKKVALILCVKH